MITSIYIHIPFCSNICTYCDFCKIYYNEEIASMYLDSLEKEIKDNYHSEKIKTLYIGGGTPSSLSINNLKKLMKIIKLFKFYDNYEFTVEVNPESIDEEKLLLFKENGVNRISMGIESTNNIYLKYLGRCHSFDLVKEKIELIKKIGIKNINVDLIYAIPKQTINDLKNDLDNIISLDITHISTYSLEIHDNTVLGIKKEKNINDDLDRDMYEYICRYLKNNGYNHYEISNFSKENYESKHNLVYWHNEKYYGFGLGASGFIDNLRYTNTRSIKDYINGKRVVYKEYFNEKDLISYELILGFRLIKGINKKIFKEKYNKELIDMYNIRDLINKGILIKDNDYIKIKEDYLYIENNILENFIE